MNSDKPSLAWLKLRNYRRFQELEIDFDPRLTVIAARNGQGKTTVLEAIAAAFGPLVGAFDNGKSRHIEQSDVRYSAVGDGYDNEPNFPVLVSAKLVVIQRRSDVPVLIQNQINSFCPASAHFIDAIDRVYWPQERADNLSLVRLDFEKLRAALIDCGVVKSDAYWAEPNKDEEQDSLYAGRSRSERFLSNEERIVFIRELRNKRRERRQARLSA